MTRTRIKPTVDRMDGGAFTGHNRPPLALLPAGFQEVFAEYDNTASRLGKAESALRDLTSPGEWTLAQETARKADADGAASAARAGSQTISTKNIDALHARERQLRADVAALSGALYLITEDLAKLRETAKKDADKHIKAEHDARDKLRASLAQVTTAAHALTSAIALREWVSDQIPWDDSVLILIEDAGPKPVRINVLTDALHNL